MAGINPAHDQPDFEIPAYTALKEDRENIAVCIEGTQALRDRADKYLPKMPAELKPSYDLRKQWATFWNTPNRVVQVMSNMAMKIEPSIQNESDKETLDLLEYPSRFL